MKFLIKIPAEGLAFLISEIKVIPLLASTVFLKSIKKSIFLICFAKEFKELFFLLKIKDAF